MWLKRLSDWNDKELKKDEIERLNFKYELQVSKYIVEILRDTIDFKIKKEKLVIIKDEKEISVDEFIFWWQITRYDEISKEQLEIKKRVKDVNDKLSKLMKMYPSDNENDNEETIDKKRKKRVELDKKKEKIIQFIKKDEPEVKKNLALLSNFKTICIKIDHIKELLTTIETYTRYNHLNNKE